MKKNTLLITLIFCTSILTACGPASYTVPVPIRQGIKSETMMNIQSLNKTIQFDVKSALTSDIVQAYEYKSNGKTPTKYFFQVDITEDINKAVKSYVETKFLNVADNSQNRLNFYLQDLYIEYTDVQGSGLVLALTNTYQSTEYYKVKVPIKVTYLKNGKEYSKDFIFEKEYVDKSTEPMRTAPQTAMEPIKYRKGMDNVISFLLSDVYNEMIIKTDKFITAAETAN